MTPPHVNRLEPPPPDLCRIDGVAGVLLQRDGNILINELPLDAGQVRTLAALTRAMCEGFRKARRVLRQVIIRHALGHLLVLSRDDAQLVLLLLEDAPLNTVSSAARDYLAARVDKPLRLPRPPAP